MRAKEITECEKVVMKCVWDSPHELSMQEITEMVNTRHGKNWKTQTVSTFLARLVKKDYLKMYRKGRCFYYQPLVDKEEYKDDVLRDYVEFWNGGSMTAFVYGLLGKRDMLTEAEFEEIKKTINESRFNEIKINEPQINEPD